MVLLLRWCSCATLVIGASSSLLVVFLRHSRDWRFFFVVGGVASSAATCDSHFLSFMVFFPR
jgi:hypothetical protein